MTRWLGYFRWAFMPLGLCALVAVGNHAAADTVDDRLLGALDALQARWDALWSAWSWSLPLVSPLGVSARTELARGAALIWELLADLVLALPMLGYREVEASARLARRSHPIGADQWSSALLSVPILIAGACAIARLVQGTAYLRLCAEQVPASAAESWSRMAAVIALGVVAVSLAWRAALQNLAEREPPTAPARWLGLIGVVPLSLAAALDASPVLSFFR